MDYEIIPDHARPDVYQLGHPTEAERSLIDGSTLFVRGPRNPIANPGRTGYLWRHGYALHSRMGTWDSADGYYWWATPDEHKKTTAVWPRDHDR